MARGDHVYVNRFSGIYNHHGIDCGDGSVIHYTSGSWQGRRRVEQTGLEEFCKGDELLVRDYAEFEATLEQADDVERMLLESGRVINRLMDKLRGIERSELDFGPDAVIARAESRLGESRFDLMSNNCEHFAAWCKTGISDSHQLNAIWKASLTGPGFLRRRAQQLLTETVERRWLP